MFDNNFQRNFKTECEIWLHIQPDRTKACILWISHTGQIVPIYDQSKDDLQHKLLILKIQQGMYIPLHQYLEKNRQCSRKLRIMLTGEVFRIGCDKLRPLSALISLQISMEVRLLLQHGLHMISLLTACQEKEYDVVVLLCLLIKSRTGVIIVQRTSGR